MYLNDLYRRSASAGTPIRHSSNCLEAVALVLHITRHSDIQRGQRIDYGYVASLGHHGNTSVIIHECDRFTATNMSKPHSREAKRSEEVKMLQSGISISIVTYNTWERTASCIATIVDDHTAIQLEILVHDNGSEDPCRTDWPDYVQIFKSPNNLGFGAGHNANLERAKFSTFMILNPDVSINVATLKSLSSALEQHQTVAAAPLLVYPDGKEQLSVRRLPTIWTELARIVGADRQPDTRWSTLVRITPGLGVLEVEQPAAAVLAVRTEVMRAIGGFDVAFPMYFEDVDLCARLRTKGSIVVLTDSKAVHDGEGTAKHYRTATTFWIENSRRRYHRKFASGPARPIILAAIWISVLTHFAAITAKATLRTDPERSMLFAKAKGYGLAMVATVAGSDDYWRRRFLKS